MVEIPLITEMWNKKWIKNESCHDINQILIFISLIFFSSQSNIQVTEKIIFSHHGVASNSIRYLLDSAYKKKLNRKNNNRNVAYVHPSIHTNIEKETILSIGWKLKFPLTFQSYCNRRRSKLKYFFSADYREL